jgi:hypothetical protein
MKLLVLGTAKVMSYKELQDARAKHAGTKVAKSTKAKEKRDRKRTMALSEADAIDQKQKVAQAREGLQPTRAAILSPMVPVAHMY